MAAPPVSVVIPSLNAAAFIDRCLSALAPGVAAGLIGEIIVADGGSADATAALAAARGARVVAAPAGRGRQLACGAAAARRPWLLFLHADSALEAGWVEAAEALIAEGAAKAGVFALKFDDPAPAAALVAAGAVLRTRIFASPYGDQGLLIARALYDEIGGYRPLPLFEDVDLVDRLVRRKGRRALTLLSAAVVTSAARYRRDGYAARVLKNACCLALYRAGVAPERIARYYA
jgi:rSAM/selenodomain-associated transferase 2